ncbi:hypothetical protein C8R43DRAFT_14513 [Mycena crocata]|nr:hypothetical protein C8R43DRAFT_14513 [Mycena crocata]
MPLKLTVLLSYDAETNAAYAERDSVKETFDRLQTHLKALKMPLPKSENVQRITGEGVRFSWTMEKENSPLQIQIEKVIKTCDKEVMRRYSIEDIELIVQPADLPVPPPLLSRKTVPKIAPSVEHTIPAALLLLPTSHRRNSFSNSTDMDVNEQSMHQQAQQFLDGLRLQLPTAEGTVPKIPPVTMSCASSIASSIPSSRNHSPQSSMPIIEGMENTVRNSFEEDEVEMALVPAEEGEAEMVLSPSPIPGLGVLPNSGHDHDIPFPILDGFPHEPFSDEVQKALDSELSGRVEKSDVPLVTQFSHALLGIRKEVAAGIVKEGAILKMLADVGVPPPDCKLAPQESELEAELSDFVVKMRARERMKRELEMLRGELADAQAKRHAVEDSVKEIARERRGPFVCPALMDAFIGISRLSTAALAAEGDGEGS